MADIAPPARSDTSPHTSALETVEPATIADGWTMPASDQLRRFTPIGADPIYLRVRVVTDTSGGFGQVALTVTTAWCDESAYVAKVDGADAIGPAFNSAHLSSPGDVAAALDNLLWHSAQAMIDAVAVERWKEAQAAS